MSKVKNHHGSGSLCRHAEVIDDSIYCELGYDTSFCQGNPRKCKKASEKPRTRRNNRRKNLDEMYQMMEED